MQTYKDALRNGCLCDDDRAELSKHGHQNSIFLYGLERSTDIAKRHVDALNIEFIFYRHGKSMQWSNCLARCPQVFIELSISAQCTVKESLTDAIRLRGV